MNRNLPINGSFYATYNQSEATTNCSGVNDNTSSYTTGTESSGATFHPTQKFSFFMNETYTNNLSGYLAQNLLDQLCSQLHQSRKRLELLAIRWRRELSVHEFSGRRCASHSLRATLFWRELCGNLHQRNANLQPPDSGYVYFFCGRGGKLRNPRQQLSRGFVGNGELLLSPHQRLGITSRIPAMRKMSNRF